MKAASCPHYLLRKLLTLGEHVEELERVASEAESKLAATRLQLNTATLRPPEYAQVRSEFDALVVEAPKLRSRAQAESRVLATAKQWVEGLPHSSKLEPAIVVDANGYDLATLRNRLAAIEREIREIEVAPMPSADIVDRIKGYVGELSRKAVPLFYRGLDGGPLDIRWPGFDANRSNANNFDSQRCNPLLMCAFLQPAALETALLREIEAIAAKPIPVADRPSMLQQLNAERL